MLTGAFSEKCAKDFTDFNKIFNITTTRTRKATSLSVEETKSLSSLEIFLVKIKKM